MLAINLTGAWKTVRAALPHLRSGGRGGTVIFINSGAGTRGYPNIAHYVSAKHGLLGLMKSLALELAPEHIRVNSILPTQVDTAMIQNEATYRLFAPDADPPTKEMFAAVSGSTMALPVPWVDPADTANALLFLASDEARHITGVALPVDAGHLVK
jgi:NAD(P)-dependent dehydrogenase (short-subunit alcohol dehydrogenase family)